MEAAERFPLPGLRVADMTGYMCSTRAVLPGRRRRADPQGHRPHHRRLQRHARAVPAAQGARLRHQDLARAAAAARTRADAPGDPGRRCGRRRRRGGHGPGASARRRAIRSTRAPTRGCAAWSCRRPPRPPTPPTRRVTRSSATPPYRCTFGSPTADATGTVALYGDSHATHWRSALLTVADRKRWAGISVTRSSCPFTQATPLLPGSARGQCVAWNRQVLQFTGEHPEITTVVVAQHRGHVVTPRGADERRVQIRGYLAAWKALPPTVQHIFVIRDTPYDRAHTGDCVMQARRRGEDVGQVCAVPRRQALKTDPAALAARRSTRPARRARRPHALLLRAGALLPGDRRRARPQGHDAHEPGLRHDARAVPAAAGRLPARARARAGMTRAAQVFCW